MSKGLVERLAFWRKSANKAELGMYLGTDFITVYRPSNGEQAEQWLTVDVQDGQWQPAFVAIHKTFAASRIHITLSAGLYQLLLADKPAVEDSEVPQALLWAIKDLVAIPVPNIHLDYFESPVTTIAKINVVVVDKTLLTAIAMAADSNQMTIVGISVEELTLSNQFSEDENARLVINHVPEQDLLLAVVKNGDLYMQRRIRGFNQLHLSTAEELGFASADNLSLEIQRSMDYFESQLRQAPVANIDILMEGQSQSLAELGAVNFNQPVATIGIESMRHKMAQLSLAELARGPE